MALFNFVHLQATRGSYIGLLDYTSTQQRNKEMLSKIISITLGLSFWINKISYFNIDEM